jgi:hypothetical protein
MSDPDARIGYLDGDILHFTCETIRDHVAQVNFFTDIAAEAYRAKGKKTNLVRMVGSAAARFFRCYFIKRGFLDGYYGFVISIMSCHAAFLKYAKLRELQKNDHIDALC